MEWPKEWPGATRDGGHHLESLWDGKPIPQPGELMQPIPEERLRKLRQFYDETLQARIQQCPELEAFDEKIIETLAGQAFRATKVWEEPTRSGPSLLETQEAEPVGGSTTRQIHRWREAFTTKAAKHILRHDDGHAIIPAPYEMTQAEIGRPRPPSYRDSILSEEEMREQLILQCVKQMIERTARATNKTDDRAAEVIVKYFFQFKAGDTDHRKPRGCLNLEKANEPAKTVLKKTKKRSGSQASRDNTHPDDTASLADATSGYNQIQQARTSNKKQRFLIQLDVWEEAVQRVVKSHPDRAPPVTDKTRIYVAGQAPCVVAEPMVVQFGATHSAQIFTERLGLVLAELRQRAGVRIETQIDDIELKSRHGPQTTYLESLMMHCNLRYFGWKMHLSEEKADQIWPRSSWIFDGVFFRAQDLMVFSPEGRDQRHRQAALQFLKRAEESDQTLTLQDLASVEGQQGPHRATHWPTPYLLCPLSAFLAGQVRKLTKQFGPTKEIWTKGIEPVPTDAIEALQRLAMTRQNGEYMRKEGPMMIECNADASGWAAGYQLTDHTSGRRIRGSVMMTDEQRSKHHTVQETEMTADVATLGIKHFNPINPHPFKPAVVGVGNDNTASVRNIDRPGSKPQMVLPTLELQCEARSRGLVPRATYKNKHFMDVETRIDYDSRPTQRYHDLGVLPEVIEKAAAELGAPIRELPTIDGTACRATRQPAAGGYIARYPDLHALPQADILTYDFGAHSQLEGKVLYLHPPELLLTKIVTKLRDEPRRAPTLITTPWWPQKNSNWHTELQELSDGVKLLPHHNEIYTYPRGTDQQVDGGAPNWQLAMWNLPPRE